MRVFVTGASGAIGSRLVPQLIDAGHEVVGAHHSPASADRLRVLGAEPVLLDLLDPRAVRKAARETGVRRFVAQSVAGFGRYAREGGPVKTEDDPVDPTPAIHTEQSVAAMNHLERVVTKFGGIALRYGVFYGAASDGTIEPVRRRRFPIIGAGGGIWSWIHLDDAAAATVLALEREGP